MTLSAPRLDAATLQDEIGQIPPQERHVAHEGHVFDLLVDTVDLGEGGVVVRDYLRHPGAVSVVALRPGPDGGDELLVIQQYRHPLGVREWEIPAGLLDVAGEPPHIAAARELAEEADLVADTWHTLAGFSASPGCMDETSRIFLARDLHDVPEAERHHREAEELGMPTGWVDLDGAVEAVFSGRISNVALTIGVLAAHAARARDWSTLRPADAPWPIHPGFRGDEHEAWRPRMFRGDR